MRSSACAVVVALAVVALTASCSTVSRAPRPELVAAIDWSGLEPIDIKGIDIAYASPTADFSGYTKVMLDPVMILTLGRINTNSGFSVGVDSLMSLPIPKIFTPPDTVL